MWQKWYHISTVMTQTAQVIIQDGRFGQPRARGPAAGVPLGLGGGPSELWPPIHSEPAYSWAAVVWPWAH